MGVFKWLRRERVTVTTHHSVNPTSTTPESQAQTTHSTTQIGTIRTEEYKRDLAEFQARRSSINKEPQDTPVKKKCGRHSLPVSCTDCTADHDNTFNYEKKSAVKYKKKSHQRARSTTPERTVYGGVPNIQFLFQNQVFMPGNLYPTTSSFSEPQKYRHLSRHRIKISPDMEFLGQKKLEFKEGNQGDSPPEFYKNNSLPYDVKNFLEGHKSEDDIDGLRAAGDVNLSSQNNSINPTKDGCDDKLWEVMSELKSLDQWADEQLQVRSPTTSKSDDSKSDTSAYGLPIASASNVDVTVDRNKTWNLGKWGVVPVQIKKLNGVTTEHVRKKRNTEINILRKCRHPNIILLMGIYPDIHGNMHLICERCVDSLFDILHVQGRILSAQTAVQYALDIANALVFLRMQGFLHTELCSTCVMITSHDAAKLADVGSCVRLEKPEKRVPKSYAMYSPEPEYVNIEDTRESHPEFEPLISEHPSETYISSNSTPKDYKMYEQSDRYRWHAPELFVPDEAGLVYPCSKSDVYSLCLVLWEGCNAAMPWKNLTYDKLKEQYTLWKTGISLPKDGTYPGCLLSLFESGLTLQRHERIDMLMLQSTLQSVKRNLDDLGYIIIPARLTPKRSTFSSTAWDTTSPTDSECVSPQHVEHKAVIHNAQESSTESEKDCSKSDASPRYETIRSSCANTMSVAEKCFISDDDQNDHDPLIRFEHIPEKEFSSACSTPIAKLRARIKEMDTPGSLHRSDSTEYCSIFSPNRTVNFVNDDSMKDQSVERERRNTKLSRSFTPKSYKPLHIKVPEFNFDSIKPLLKDRNSNEKSSYNFDIKNYSLPTTPIARSNKLRKNAWLSGDLRATEKTNDNTMSPEKEDLKITTDSFSNSATTPVNTCDIAANNLDNNDQQQPITPANDSPESIDTVIQDSFTGLKVNPPQDFFSTKCDEVRDRMTCSLNLNNQDRNLLKYKVEEDILANVNVKPLVAIHERWIYEANRKTYRSMSLPEDNRSQTSAVKPASHCVDTLQKSLPQLNTKKSGFKVYRTHPVSPSNGKYGWEHFCQARDTIAKSVNFSRSPELRHRSPELQHRSPELQRGSPEFQRRNAELELGTINESQKCELKIDQSTDTKSIEEFIRDMIRKEFQHLLQEISDEASTVSKSEDIVNKGVANIMESLNSNEDIRASKKEPIKSFSRVKINGNNKPLLHITFTRTGENSLQVLDNCVNVTICDNGNNNVSTSNMTCAKEKLNQSMEDTLTDDVHISSLKRCQAFNALQEARSTEDLYIDDDLSTMQDNFGGKVKLIPLHGSLHEILCEKEDDCCLIKVKQENGCDTIYFRCDNSDTESRDAIDGLTQDQRSQDTVVFKRSISLVEERIQRVFPKDKRPQTSLARKQKPSNTRIRPKSEIFIPTVPPLIESRALSNSSPSLPTCDRNDEVEVNIENVLCYQDSSSDECLKCQSESDDFELLERTIEEDFASVKNGLSPISCCLPKISEENLSNMTDTD